MKINMKAGDKLICIKDYVGRRWVKGNIYEVAYILDNKFSLGNIMFYINREDSIKLNIVSWPDYFELYKEEEEEMEDFSDEIKEWLK